ncbi:MAG TPA: Gfo/Idh/MocA family oxidoreductase [Micromonosporaceae bacterium]|nr:Gfo/Idh/MocA family oxidoreductase [Micromonosporaceae bacterium]
MHSCRVGLVGAGNVASRHARVLAGFDDVELVGVTDVMPEAAHRLADEHGTRVFDSVEALIGAGLDAVYVCVPPFAHGAAEEAVLHARIPLFVEKPVAADLETALRIDALIAQRDVLTAVGHHWRYLTVVDRARELLADRPVRLVNGVWLDRVPPVQWWTRRDRSGGPVVEQAAHVLDLIRLLAGEVSQVAAFGDGSPPLVDGADIDGATVAALRFTDGAVGTLTSACVLDWKHCAAVEIIAEGLVLQVGEDELLVRQDDREQRFRGDPAAARVAVDRSFIDAVLGVGDDIRVPYAQAVRTHRLACAVAESVLTGQTVRLPEPPAGQPERQAESVWAMAGWDG